MDPILRATLTSWDLRAEVIIVLFVAGAFYTLGWWRVRHRTRKGEARNLPRVKSRWQAGALWRPFVYWTGLLIVAIALLSPIDVLGSYLLTMHMVQHVLLVMLAPPLLLLANPFPYGMWGLPARFRRPVGRLFVGGAPLRRFLEKTTGAGLVWIIFIIIYWGWHDPNAYNLALQNSLVHDLEHVSFFLVSILFWWHVVGAGPRIHKPLQPFARFVYTLSAIPPNMLAGMVLAFAAAPIYSHYEAMPRLWGLPVLEDQRIGGVIMWVPGSMMYIIAALFLVARWLQREEQKPVLPQSAWAGDDSLIAPGWENRT